MATMTTDDLDEMIRERLEMWSWRVASKLKEALRKNKVILTQSTLESLQTKVLQGAGTISSSMQLAFQESGRMKDMKHLQYKSLPPVAALEEYVKAVGLDKFGYVPGYKPGQFPLSQSAAIKRIAWGIAVHRRENYTHKPSKWFNKTFYSALNELIDDIATEFQKSTGEVLGLAWKSL